MAILYYLSHGKSYKAIAHELGMTRAVVGNRVSKMLAKAGVNSSAGLVGLAFRNGWII